MRFDTLYAPPTPPSLDDIIFHETKQKVEALRNNIKKQKENKANKQINSQIQKQKDQEEFMINGEEIIFIDPKNKNPVQQPYYYFNPKNNTISYSYNSYFYTPGTIIRKVPQSTLGSNVLGRAFTSLNYIEILETLHGLEFEEVKQHELNHINYPHLTEWEIRQKTRQELPFAPKYH